MSRVFSVMTVLRQTSPAPLREVLDRLKHGDLPVPWDDLGKHGAETICRLLKTLAASRYDEVEGVLRAFFDLACTGGICAIREAAACLDLLDVLDGLPAGNGLYDQVAFVWLRNHDVIDFAGLIHQVENLTWWRRRDDLPRREPSASPETLRRLGESLSALFEAEQGRGRHCTVEFLSRTRTRHYFAYPDDYVQNVNTHDDHGELVPRTFRRTFSIVFAFDPAEGALELYAGRASPRIKQQIEAVFARVVFGVDLRSWGKPSYDLDRLKFRDTALPTDPEDRVQVSIRQMRFEIPGTPWQVSVKADPAGGPADIYNAIDTVLDRERVPLSTLSVNLVTLGVEFLDAPRGPGRTLVFDVATPNTCSLRHQRQDRIDLAMKYLARWGIYVRRADADLGAAG